MFPPILKGQGFSEVRLQCSPAPGKMENVAGDSPGNGMKRLMNLGREDRISGLPDDLIQHIISFLPSTKEAIQTAILSKRWLNQWTRVPVLVFESPVIPSDRFDVKFARFIDNALHLYDSSKIRKLHVNYKFEKDPNFISKLRFVTRKNVEELILDRYQGSDVDHYPSYKLPKFIFDNDSLVKLQFVRCDFQPVWRVNWPSLKVLKIHGCLNGGQLIDNVLSGSPSLEFLEIKDFHKRSFFTFSSMSLKVLILADVEITCNFDVSCPNLEELYVKRQDMKELITLPGKAIKDFVSGSPLLHTLEVIGCLFEELVIASKSLKKLVIGGLDEGSIEISCPNIEELTLYGLANEPFKVANFPSLIRATLNFDIAPLICGEHVAKMILEQLQNVKELSMGSCSFIKVLSDVGMEGVSYPWSNNKILTLDRPDFEHLSGIMCALRSSSTLERLVITLEVHQDGMTLHPFGENYWNSNETVVNCLLSHLKTVEIIGLCKRDVQCELVLNFIKFLLKNARLLEKLVLVISEDGGTGFAFEVSQKVSSFPRCSPHAIVELSCSK